MRDLLDVEFAVQMCTCITNMCGLTLLPGLMCVTIDVHLMTNIINENLN